MVLKLFIDFNFHKALFVCFYTVYIEELRQAAEIELLIPIYIFFGKVSAFYVYGFRTGTFPIAYKFDHAEIKYDFLGNFRIVIVSYIKFFDGNSR